MSHSTFTRPELGPYDTGAVLEAKPWIPYGTKITEATPEENFGKVDFDDECSDSVLTIQVKRTAPGKYTVEVLPHTEAESITLVMLEN